jgi:hypothetical protein
MPALLPVGDELQMNFEGLGVSSSTVFIVFRNIFELRMNFAVKGWPG